jgi:hypothetical protein
MRIERKKFGSMSSRHTAKHVNLKSNTIMKKPRRKYIKEINIYQIFFMKNQKKLQIRMNKHLPFTFFCA